MAGSFTLKEIAKLTSSRLIGNENAAVTGVETLEGAKSSDVSFLSNGLYSRFLKTTKAAVVFVREDAPFVPERNYLVCHDPSLAFQQVIDLLHPEESLKSSSGIHSTAVIDPSVSLGENVTIGPYVVIEKEAQIGAHTTLSAHVFVGAQTMIKDHCLIHPNVTIHNKTSIGNRVIIQSGAVIGSSGFGYATNEMGQHVALRQVGSVEIEDDVEIGANTAVDRGRFKKTIIRRGTKIDNLVQIAHQVEIGEDNLIISQVGIAGSAKTGSHCILAGQVGVIGHIELGDGTILAARAAAIRSLPDGGIYTGVPATPVREYNEQLVHLRNLKKHIKRIKELEKRVKELES